MSKLIILLVILAAVAVGAFFLRPAAKTTLSKLKVLGNRIFTEEGQAIRLRGIVFGDPFLLEKDDFDRDGAPDHHFTEKIAEDFVRVKKLGANVVRLMVYPGYYRLVGNDKYLSAYGAGTTADRR